MPEKKLSDARENRITGKASSADFCSNTAGFNEITYSGTGIIKYKLNDKTGKVEKACVKNKDGRNADAVGVLCGTARQLEIETGELSNENAVPCCHIGDSIFIAGSQCHLMYDGGMVDEDIGEYLTPANGADYLRCIKEAKANADQANIEDYQCKIVGFELPQKNIDDVEGYLLQYGHPKYLAYFEKFPSGLEASWEKYTREDMALIFGWGFMGSVLLTTGIGGNAKIHHAKITRKECEKLNVRLIHLPPYSPDPNPIEFAWKDGKKELGMLEFNSIVENVEYTLTNMMKERKIRYSEKRQEKFSIQLKAA